LHIFVWPQAVQPVFWSVHVADIRLQLTTHSSTPDRWKAELAWLVDLQRMVYPYEWSPISYRSSTGPLGSSPAKDRRYAAVPRNQPRAI